MLVRAPIPARDAPAASKEERGPSITVRYRNLQNSKKRLELDLMVILNERQQNKLAFERDFKAVEEVLARKGVPPIVRETLVTLLGNEDDVNAGSSAGRGEGDCHKQLLISKQIFRLRVRH